MEAEVGGNTYAVCNLGPGQEYVLLQVPAELPLGATSITVRVGTGSTTLEEWRPLLYPKGVRVGE